MNLIRSISAMNDFFLALAVAMLLLLITTAWPGLRAKLDRGLRLAPASRARFAAAAVPAAVAAAAYLYLLVRYLVSPIFLDHVEAQVMSVSWLFAQGEPIHHGPLAANRYALVYGPLLYLIVGGVMKLLGPGLVTAKLAPVACAAASPVAYYRALRGRALAAPPPLCLLASGTLVLFLLPTWAFWTRSEPFLVLIAALSLGVAQDERPGRAATALGLCLGAMGAFKFMAPFFLLPSLALLFKRHGAKTTGICLLVAAATLLAPFLLPGVSLANYLYWLGLTAAAPFDVLSAIGKIAHAAFCLLVPFAVLLSHPRPLSYLRENDLFYGSLLAATAGATFVSMVPGSGFYAQLPVLPAIGYAAVHAQLSKGDRAVRRRLGFAFVAAFFTVAWIGAFGYWRYDLELFDHQDRSAPVAADVEAFLARNPGKQVGIGYTINNPYLGFFRPLGVFGGSRFYLDAAHIMNMKLEGVNIPSSTVDAMRTCANDIWLIQKGQEPFRFLSYIDGSEIFPDELRAAFQESYRRTEQTAYYDVWSCARAPLGRAVNPAALNFPLPSPDK